MTRKDVEVFIVDEFPTKAHFQRWNRPVYCDGLTLTNVTSRDSPDYIKAVQISWKSDVISTLNFDYDLRKWSDGKKLLAFQIWKEIKKFHV